MYSVMIFLRDRRGLYEDGGLVYAADPAGIEDPITEFTPREIMPALERLRREVPNGTVLWTVSLN